MSKNKFDWGIKAFQATSDVAELATGAGVPGSGLIVSFSQFFYDKYLQKRFKKFITEAEVDQELIDEICNDEAYSNCFYAVLETVRQTHSKIGVSALALIYREHWNDESFLISAMESFSRISDNTIEAFISLYQELPADRRYLDLMLVEGEQRVFHPLYNEAVELIRRNFFVMTRASGGMTANGPIQGMVGEHTRSYCEYCVAAKALNAPSVVTTDDPV